MKTRTINIYEFKELSKEAKEKAINNFKENNQYDLLSDDINEYLREKFKENKIYITNEEKFKIHYSLSYSQGDGLCFVGSFRWKNYNIKIEHTGMYYHSNSTTIYIETNFGNEVKQKIDDQFELIYQQICKEAEKQGYALIEAEDSEENIKEAIKINEYEFLGNGKRA